MMRRRLVGCRKILNAMVAMGRDGRVGLWVLILHRGLCDHRTKNSCTSMFLLGS